MRYVRSFVGFWYDFIIGDDWLVAVLIVGGLLASWALLQAGIRPVFWIVPLLVLIALPLSVHRTATGRRGGEERPSDGGSPGG